MITCFRPVLLSSFISFSFCFCEATHAVWYLFGTRVWCWELSVRWSFFPCARPRTKMRCSSWRAGLRHLYCYVHALVVEHFSLVKWILLLLIIIIALWVFVKAVRISTSLVSVSSVLVCFDFFGRKTCSVPLVSELTPWTLGACGPQSHWAEHGHAH